MPKKTNFRKPNQVIDNRPKIFSIETYQHWKIEEDKDLSKRKYICTHPVKKDKFVFYLSINSSLNVEFNCLYYASEENGVVLYRGDITQHLREFWYKLGSEYFNRTSHYRDAMIEKVLKEFDFNWEGDK